jgi:hypothetical protein
MRKLRVLALSVVLGAGMTPAAFLAAPVHAVHADQYDCSNSYMPCDGSNLDYNDSLGDTPMPYDENWEGWSVPYDTNSPLGDPCGYPDAGC